MNASNNANKKIGQLTYHAGNFGSILQCYATQKIFESCGYSVDLILIDDPFLVKVFHALKRRLQLIFKTIRYPKYSKEILRLYKNAVVSNRGNNLGTSSIEQMKLFERNYIRTSKLTSSKIKSISQTNEYCCFISGSDQIWSYSFPIPDENYYLRFAPKKKRIAFAPSFGTERIYPYNQKQIHKYLSQYAMLSIREPSGANIIRQMLKRDCAVLDDPVLQIDKSFWQQIISQAKTQNIGEYICTFFIDEPSETVKKQIQTITEKLNIEVVNFGYHRDFGKHVDGGPAEFLSIIQNAQLLLTDSFHAMAFSIVLHTKAYAFKRNYHHGADQSTRIIELLERCDLVDRFIQEGKILSKDEILSQSFITADECFDNIRKKSKDYINGIGKYLEKNDCIF